MRNWICFSRVRVLRRAKPICRRRPPDRHAIGCDGAAIACKAHATHGLHPAEISLPACEPFGSPRSRHVARCGDRARSPSATLIARDVRSDLERAARGDELRRGN